MAAEPCLHVCGFVIVYVVVKELKNNVCYRRYVKHTQINKVKHAVYGYFKNGGKKNDIDSQDCNNNGPVKPVPTANVITHTSIFILDSVG